VVRRAEGYAVCVLISRLRVSDLRAWAARTAGVAVLCGDCEGNRSAIPLTWHCSKVDVALGSGRGWGRFDLASPHPSDTSWLLLSMSAVRPFPQEGENSAAALAGEMGWTREVGGLVRQI
jgi:hypothetical protein